MGSTINGNLLLSLAGQSLPEIQVADAGYGSEQNYQNLDTHQIAAYVKPTGFDRRQSKSYNPNSFNSDH
jgi:hypothetical protein